MNQQVSKSLAEDGGAFTPIQLPKCRTPGTLKRDNRLQCYPCGELKVLYIADELCRLNPLSQGRIRGDEPRPLCYHP